MYNYRYNGEDSLTRLTEQDKQFIIAEFKNGANCVKIGDKLKRHKGVVRSFLIRKGYKFNLSRIHQRYSLNEKFFETIESPEQAYWLGWMFSDGVNSGREISIRLQEEDEDVLHVLNKLIGSDRPVKTIDYSRYGKPWKNQKSLTISNLKIAKDIAKLGCVPRKSLILKFPNLPSSVLKYFIRGLFEGDGCLSLSDKYKTAQFYICGTKDVCESVSKILTKLKIKSYIIKTPTIFTVRVYGNRQIKSVMDWIYNKRTDLKLSRKFNKYQKLVSWYHN